MGTDESEDEQHTMKIKTESYSRLIVEKDRRYLYRAKNKTAVWHWSSYDAWYDSFKRPGAALAVARKFGGIVRKFNPITGEIT